MFYINPCSPIQLSSIFIHFIIYIWNVNLSFHLVIVLVYSLTTYNWNDIWYTYVWCKRVSLWWNYLKIAWHHSGVLSIVNGMSLVSMCGQHQNYNFVQYMRTKWSSLCTHKYDEHSLHYHEQIYIYISCNQTNYRLSRNRWMDVRRADLTYMLIIVVSLLSTSICTWTVFGHN